MWEIDPIFPQLLMFGSIISLGIIAVWIPIAYMVGKKNEELAKSNSIIE